MTPREIDALVAEKVFNQSVKWVEVLDYQGKRKEPYLCESNEGYGASDEVDYYSTSIADAWEVIPNVKYRSAFTGEYAMDPITIAYQSNCNPNDFSRMVWTAHFRHSDSFAWSDTAPMAICLAALKAVGVEVPE